MATKEKNKLGGLRMNYISAVCTTSCCFPFFFLPFFPVLLPEIVLNFCCLLLVCYA